jgi:hypothetical protein
MNFWSLKKIRGITLAIAILFLAATTLLSAHAHAKAHEDSAHSCSVCQLSHSAGKALSAQNLQSHFELSPVSFEPVLDSLPIFSNPFQVPTIRGPPLS